MNKISIIIPALDEESLINVCIQNLFEIFKGEYEIIVVDGDQNGSTINVIKYDGVKKYISQPGRANQMNLGAEHATGENLIFLHVDSELPRSAQKQIENTLKDFPAGAFNIKFKGPKFIYSVLSFTVSRRSRWNRIPYGDQAIFMRKQYFEEMGGYAEIPIMEDVDMMLRIKNRGDQIKILSERVTTSARRWEAEGVLFTMLRNPILSFLFYRGVPADKLKAYYKSGKLVYKTNEQ